MAVITQEQVILLEQSSRFQNVAKQFVKDQATYISQQIGTSGNTAGLSPVDWAKHRYIAKGIVLHPNSQDYQSLTAQFAMLLKGQNVWDTDVETTISAMITSGKFEELAILTFAVRAAVIEF